MADQHDPRSKPARTAPPPFIGPPRAGALGPKARADRPTLPPFSPPFVKRPSPAVPTVREAPSRAERVTPSVAPPWLDAQPNEMPRVGQPGGAAGLEWVNPDEPPAVAPVQAATGIDWLDSPAPESAVSTAPSTPSAPSAEDVDDVFGWDPAEERAGGLDSSFSGASLDALKEVEPWALPGSEPSGSTSDDIAAALERVAARIRSGDLAVPRGAAAPTDEAVLASVLAALLQRARG